jgi:hypothetical protein
LLRVYQQVREPLSIPSDSGESRSNTTASVSLRESQAQFPGNALDSSNDDDCESSKPLENSDESQPAYDDASLGRSQSANEHGFSDVSKIPGRRDLDSEALHNWSERTDLDASTHTLKEGGLAEESVNSLTEEDFNTEPSLNEKVFSSGLALEDEPEVITISTCGSAIEVVTHDESVSSTMSL